MRASHVHVLAAVLAVAAAACGARSGSGPAWPKSAGRVEVDPEKDGGESLDPQHASHVSAIERADDRTPAGDKPADDKPADDKPAGDKVDEKDEAGAKKDSPTTGEVPIEVIEVRPEDIQLDP